MSLQQVYTNIKNEIEQAQMIFEGTYEVGDEDILQELLFCLCTPQTKAQKGWIAIEELNKQQLIKYPNEEMIAFTLGKCGVRFKNKKARYISESIYKFESVSIKSFIMKIISHKGIIETRNWFAGNVKGMGMKEASHFLRNIGFGKDICILDRHIMKKLKEETNIIIPDVLSKKEYLRVEQEMIAFANKINIPVCALDFVFWAETHNGEIFK